MEPDLKYSIRHASNVLRRLTLYLSSTLMAPILALSNGIHLLGGKISLHFQEARADGGDGDGDGNDEEDDERSRH